MQSLYSQYIFEREGKQILEVEEGFAVYSFLTDTQGVWAVYIEDIFVVRGSREAGVAASIADSVADKAIQAGCKRMYGSVAPKANNSTASLKVLLAYGFQLDSCTSDLILFKKEL